MTSRKLEKILDYFIEQVDIFPVEITSFMFLSQHRETLKPIFCLLNKIVSLQNIECKTSGILIHSIFC